jgi:hypothetical protein
VKLEGGWLMVKPEKEDLGLAMAFMRKLKAGKLYSAVLKEFRRKRSLDANAKMWALINEMSTIIHISPEEIYQGYIPDVGGNFHFVPALPADVPKWEKDWCDGHIGRMVEDVGPCRSSDLRGHRLLKLYRGSSEYDVPTFNRLLDLVIQDCQQLGISTMSERERSLLMDEWGKTYAG